jgi:hypothetical protein
VLGPRHYRLWQWSDVRSKVAFVNILIGLLNLFEKNLPSSFVIRWSTIVVFVRTEGKNVLNLVSYFCSWDRFLEQAQGAAMHRKNYSIWKSRRLGSYTLGKSHTGCTEEEESEPKLQRSIDPLRLNKEHLLLFFFSNQLSMAVNKVRGLVPVTFRRNARIGR